MMNKYTNIINNLFDNDENCRENADFLQIQTFCRIIDFADKYSFKTVYYLERKDDEGVSFEFQKGTFLGVTSKYSIVKKDNGDIVQIPHECVFSRPIKFFD